MNDEFDTFIKNNENTLEEIAEDLFEGDNYEA